MTSSAKNVWIRIAFHMGAKVREDGRIHIYRISDGTLYLAESPVAVLRNAGCTDVTVHCKEVKTGTLLSTIIDISGVHESWPDTIPDNDYRDYYEFMKDSAFGPFNYLLSGVDIEEGLVDSNMKDSNFHTWWMISPHTGGKHEE